MNVNIICIGKLKEAYWREAVAEYAKRIGGYASFKVLELAEVKLPENPSESQILQGLMSMCQQECCISTPVTNCPTQHIFNKLVLRLMRGQCGGRTLFSMKLHVVL